MARVLESHLDWASGGRRSTCRTAPPYMPAGVQAQARSAQRGPTRPGGRSQGLRAWRARRPARPHE
eukprot:2887915-Alexandrium_andersonii.AAC.1